VEHQQTARADSTNDQPLENPALPFKPKTRPSSHHYQFNNTPPIPPLNPTQQVVDYVVGFDDLGGKDDFTTEMLEERLAAADVLKLSDAVAAARRGDAKQPQRSIRSGLYQRESDDEDSDFD